MHLHVNLTRENFEEELNTAKLSKTAKQKLSEALKAFIEKSTPPKILQGELKTIQNEIASLRLGGKKIDLGRDDKGRLLIMELFFKGFPTIIARGERPELFEVKLISGQVKKAIVKKANPPKSALPHEWFEAETEKHIPFFEVIGWRD